MNDPIDMNIMRLRRALDRRVMARRVDATDYPGRLPSSGTYETVASGPESTAMREFPLSHAQRLTEATPHSIGAFPTPAPTTQRPPAADDAEPLARPPLPAPQQQTKDFAGSGIGDGPIASTPALLGSSASVVADTPLTPEKPDSRSEQSSRQTSGVLPRAFWSKFKGALGFR